ncbi:MAG: fasciclin domain-containing protein [Flavihumibacter sp.]
MFSSIRTITKRFLLPALVLGQLVACNKIPEVEDIKPVTPGGESIADIISNDASYSVLKAGLTRAGLMTTLSNKNNKLTLLAPDDAAFALGGINETVINALPLTQLVPLLQYHVIPQALPTSTIAAFGTANVQMPTLLQPSSSPLFKMSSFPAVNAMGTFVNNIPVKSADRTAANGVIHTVYAPVVPPSQMMRSLIHNDPELSLFEAAVKRASEGQTGLTLDSLLNYPYPNLTVFAPTNAAMGQVLTALGLPSDPAVFAMLPVATVKGLVAYHILASNGTPVQRLFTVNFTTGTYETLIGPAPYPGLQISMANPLAPTVKGAVNPTAANIVGANLHAVNGVLHKIDQVLLPQPF